MSNIAAVSYDQLLDGVVAQLQPLALPSSGGPAGSARMHVIKRYMGESFDPDDASERGIAGRTPAVLVAFAGEKPFRKTVSGKRQRVEATIAAICISDSHRSKDDRAVVLSMISDVRKQLGNRKLGLPIQPLQYAGIAVAAEKDVLFAYAARFTTRLAVDYTIDPGADLLLSAGGQIVAPLDGAPVAPTAPTLIVHGTPGTARYAYDLQVQYAGPFSDFSPWAAINTAPNALGGANYIAVAWPAAAGATGYRLRRRWAPVGGPTTGVIYSGSATSFNDDGTVAGDGNTLPARGLNYHGDF